MQASREVFWNISYHFLLYPLAIVAVGLFVYGFYRRIRIWKLGKSQQITGSFGQRLKLLLIFAFGHARILKEKYPGIMHALIFIGFAILFLGTVTVSFDYDIWHLLLGQSSFLVGDFYKIFSLILDIAGVLAVIGILIAMFRRFVQRPQGLNQSADQSLALIWILFILVTGFMVEGARIAATIPKPSWEIWSPVGMALSDFFPTGTLGWYQWLWWIHMLTALGFIAYIPYSSRLRHIFTSATNIYLRSQKPMGELSAIDIEHAETFGAGKINDFSWKQLLDLDACTSCGRCQDQCPAFNSDKPLSPKKVILDLLDNLNKKSSQLIKGESLEGEAPLVGSAVQADEIWACTTCAACVEACPVFIEQIDKIVELRRDRVLMDGDFPNELNQTFKGMENNFNPWGIGFSSRADWSEGLNIKRLDQGQQAEYLWFVGCAGSFDDRIKKVSQSFTRLLNSVGLDVAILGAEEKCCGETARRLGNEYLAQTLMEMNVEMFNELGVKKIITFCPHCFNTLKYEYPQFKGNFEVVHSTQLLAELIQTGKLKIKPNNSPKITFHDSCYLGRYSNIYEQPRQVLKAISGNGLIELKRNREQSFCCGAGGGRMWLEENLGQRINHLRTEEIISCQVKTVASACPYCLTMITDGLKDKDAIDSIDALDIIELVEKNLSS
ncbi:MAG TPA: 4Fe-4S dicluster domain-containing protein [bacterium]|nr:4Fe-4S dicluster domain-containing protein [bacterium]